MKLNELFEQLSKSELSTVAHACNPSIVEAEMGAVAASPRSYCSNTTEKQNTDSIVFINEQLCF